MAKRGCIAGRVVLQDILHGILQGMLQGILQMHTGRHYRALRKALELGREGTAGQSAGR